jgi:hypothetical protein
MSYKKVGIITMHQVLNYGSFLQAYATQRIIEKLGYKAEIIDYKYPNELHGTKKSLKKQVLHFFNVATKNIIPGRPYNTYLKRYKEAHSKYFHLSEYYSSREAILKRPPIYDIYLVGSDQVWNDKFIKNDETFFAGFAPEGRKKIAFASSFGKKDISAENTGFYQDNLRKLAHIAVREKSGVELVNRLTGKSDTRQVLDPTLLLDRQEWEKILVPFTRTKKKYVFVYGSHMSDYMLSIAWRIAKEKGWELFRVNGSIVDYFGSKGHCLLDIGPLEWLGLISKAEMVICCSFHGLVFSILFNRPFLAMFTGDNQFDTRFDSLLNLVSLQSHRIDVKTPEENYLEAAFNTDWDMVNEVIEKKRDESIRVLEEFLKN